MEKNMRGGGEGADNMIMLKMIMVVLICSVSVSLMIMTTMIPSVDAADYKYPDLYVVGDVAFGWRPRPSPTLIYFEDWASRHDFYVGDWLFFMYDESRYNVLVVNQTDYNKCSSVHPLENITGGAGQDLFHLTSEQTYYFISGMDRIKYCIRVAVIVKEYIYFPKAPAEPEPLCPAPEPTPSPPKNVSPSDSGRNVVSTFIGTIAVACTLVWVVVWIL